jgi:hypothetical protein
MEEYAEYLDENGMITIKWWAFDDTNIESKSGDGNKSDDSDYDVPEHTLS